MGRYLPSPSNCFVDVVNFNKLRKRGRVGKGRDKKRKIGERGLKTNDLNEEKLSSFASSSEYSRTAAGEGRCFRSAFSDFTMAFSYE
jgi:hypothetical protein